MILKTNDNILRQSEYSLKIINGELAEVYIDSTGYNSDLMRDDYWINFLKTTDFITIPLKSIDSLVKNQSVWYTNNSTKDSCVVNVSNDYNNNIIEFLNKGVKNANLDFKSIEQLIFIVEISFINSVGKITTKNVFVGRPTLKKNTDKLLTFEINNLDYVLSGSDFGTNVLQSPTASYYNFINIKESFEKIYNNPHGVNDEYAYPVCPFRINEETYLPSDGLNYINETTIIPDGYTVYAENSVYGEENRVQTFYYRDSPECGFTDIKMDSFGNKIYSVSKNLSSFRYYTNPDELDGVSSDSELFPHKLIVKNIFRSFRPIGSFISESVVTSMKVATINEKECDFVTANSTEWRVDIGDEIMLFEQKFDFIKELEESNWKSIVMTTMTSNVLYYNRTKDIMYWNNMIQQAMSPTLPALFLDCRLPGYFNLRIEWDNHYHWNDRKDGNYENRHYMPANDIMLGYDSLGLKNNMRALHIHDYTYRDFSIAQNAIIGWIGQVKTVIEPDGESPLVTAQQMNSIATLKPKTIRIGANGKLIYLYQNVTNLGNTGEVEGGQEKWSICERYVWFNEFYGWQGIKKFQTTYPYLWEDGTVYEITPKFEDEFLISTISLQSSDVYSSQNIIAVNADLYIKTWQPSIYTPSISYLSGNMTSYNDGTYYFEYYNLPTLGEYEYRISLIYDKTLFVTKSYGQRRILDINIELDRVILSETDGRLTYEQISDGTVIYNDVNSTNLEYMLSRERTLFNFVDTADQTLFNNYQEDFDIDIKLLAYEGDRYKSGIALSNSFFKNSYCDNNGIRNIGFEQDSFEVNDTMYDSISVIPSNYNKLECDKYDIVKNNFENTDNDEATTKEEDDLNYDAALNINMYSNIDLDIGITVTRTAVGIDWVASNTFEEFEEGSITPSNYNSFELPLTGTFDGIIIFVNFYDGELQLDKTFNGSINRRTLEVNGVPIEVVETAEPDRKYLWKDKNTLDLKFPFLYRKYSDSFRDALEAYWVDTDGNIRTTYKAKLVFEELILFNENYTMFNIGEKRININSDDKYINGYDIINGSLTPFENNKGSFYIESISYDFKNKKTTMNLISI